MTPDHLLKRLARRALRPLILRLDQANADIASLAEDQGRLAAEIERVGKTQETMFAYVDRVREELTAEHRSGLAELDTALRTRGDAWHDEIEEQIARLATESAELRRMQRLTQALLERTPARSSEAAPADTTGDPEDGHRNGAPAPSTDGSAPDVSRFSNITPTFDLLYRAFEDRNRGSRDEVLDRFRADYSDLIEALPDGEEPVADLGCGRGELVEVLAEFGHEAVGVDSNLGQLVDPPGGRFVQADLFDWLDEQRDASLKAVFAIHVIEHVPIDLKIRLVFEAARVLVPGGLLVMETPNALSVSTAATNFWVDPTHEAPVHPALVDFLALEAGFTDLKQVPLHRIDLEFGGEPGPLRDDLQSLLLGHGDMAFIARR